MLSQAHEVFLEVARQLSFTKAGQTLFLSQSAVSKRVRALEQHYRTGLFERLGKHGEMRTSVVLSTQYEGRAVEAPVDDFLHATAAEGWST